MRTARQADQLRDGAIETVDVEQRCIGIEQRQADQLRDGAIETNSQERVHTLRVRQADQLRDGAIETLRFLRLSQHQILAGRLISYAMARLKQ